MPVTDVNRDPDALTLTITAEFDAGAERTWELWSDPRQLEGWWGPPTYPATFTEHDLSPGSRVAYFMTGPEGQRHHGWWRVEEVDAPRRLRFEDGFADEDGRPSAEMPSMTVTVTIAESDGTSTMAVETQFGSREEMERMIEMGMDEGMAAAMGQIDSLLAGQRA